MTERDRGAAETFGGGIAPADLERARRAAAAALSPRRFEHVVRVVETARGLALRHGVDPLRVELAAWLHDLARERPAEELVAAARRGGWVLDAAERADPLLLHGPVAAWEAARKGLARDPDVLEAVRWHTTARPGLGPVGCIVFLADKLEPARDYPGVDALRRLAAQDVDGAMAAVLDDLIRHCLDRGYWLPAVTVAARNHWRQRRPLSGTSAGAGTGPPMPKS
ncbi:MULTISPECIES: bis(5'-nucleosyl)-tetraphosphatase (symmetrical) YqeK [Thermaerobacter]|uniref:bis(5'-nucleosyl)-tetraphosphatase (symmetrical) n=1 Tax=Thermaerobacter composti TaxID=554949 RepID=A0ABZ0QN78_9FIRM|nr:MULTISPECIES: bis(5'-nucleosyl)-tetraphosphatase (symmetrical) YqeK [Thermaerobacter]QBS36948.1 HD domain-containing protein [Thermaerobacter sp. FW80]WPD18944.1 bis(5'-nucleosyl)-tetraphosphatase (symmetrical) YqeK [Thermaerobacter composti]